MSAKDIIEHINNMPEEEYDAMIEKFAIELKEKRKKQEEFYESEEFNKYIDIIRKIISTRGYVDTNNYYAESEDKQHLVEAYSKDLVRDKEKILLTPEIFNKLSSSIDIYNEGISEPDAVFPTVYVPYQELVFETVVGQRPETTIYEIENIYNERVKSEFKKRLLNKKLKKLK